MPFDGAARVSAVLGPTNTGKTHYAVERMLAHRTGVIGLPLRLLAREVYDRIVALRGPSVVALVTDEQSRPVAGAAVTFALPDGADATVAPSTALTGSDGEAAFQVTLGTRVGTLAAQVAVSTASGAQTLTAPVSLTAVSADANGIAAVSGDGQSAPAGADLPDRLMVQVTDGFGNPIPGVAIMRVSTPSR